MPPLLPLLLLLLPLLATPSPSWPATTPASRLLFYMPMASRSYKTVYRPLAHEMAARGHQVVMVTPYRDEVTRGSLSSTVLTY